MPHCWASNIILLNPSLSLVCVPWILFALCYNLLMFLINNFYTVYISQTGLSLCQIGNGQKLDSENDQNLVRDHFLLPGHCYSSESSYILIVKKSFQLGSFCPTVSRETRRLAQAMTSCCNGASKWALSSPFFLSIKFHVPIPFCFKCFQTSIMPFHLPISTGHL